MQVALIRLKARYCHLRFASGAWLILLSDMCDRKIYQIVSYKFINATTQCVLSRNSTFIFNLDFLIFMDTKEFR